MFYLGVGGCVFMSRKLRVVISRMALEKSSDV